MDTVCKNTKSAEAKFYIVYPNRLIGKGNPKDVLDRFLMSYSSVSKMYEKDIGMVPFIISQVHLTNGILVGEERDYLEKDVFEFKSICIYNKYDEVDLWADMCIRWAQALVEYYGQTSTIVSVISDIINNFIINNPNVKPSVSVQYASSSCEAQYIGS